MSVDELKSEQTKRMIYTVLAVFLCFVGPTYLVAVIDKVIPQLYAMTLGFISFLIGVFFIFRLEEE